MITMSIELIQAVNETDECTEQKKKRDKPCEDHLGNKFPSFAAMCRYHHMTTENVRGRIKRGATVEEALTQRGLFKSSREKEKPFEDHLGNRFESFAAMCRYHGANTEATRSRVKKGMPIGEALTMPRTTTKIKPAKDHLGTTFASVSAMCEHWGVTTSAYNGRIKNGWTVEEALTTPVQTQSW